MSDLTVSLPGADLATPMVPEGADPSVLPWEIGSYTLTWQSGRQHAHGSVTHYSHHGPEGWPWSAHCSGPGRTEFGRWFPTAEAARAAVEEHIAAQVETHLKEGLSK